ncbi:MAG: 50S ribosomal protein L33 [Erysipelotrichaceae bacterium]|nr:50S ribosomal protein L33 [Erysipelotrichaceae bacterium]
MGREKTFLICEECLSRNYTISKRSDAKERLEIRKYCPHCHRYTLHKESK